MNAVQRHPGADEDRRQTLTDDPPKLPLVWLCVGAVVVVLVVAFALLWFAQPMADDFARGYEGLPPIIPSVLYEYRAWTGRWAAVAVNYVLTSFDLTRVYPLLLLANCIVLALAALAIISAAGFGPNLRQRTAFAAGALALYWAGMPHPGESVYWLTGSTDNLLGPSLAVLLIAALLRHRPKLSWLGIASAGGLALLTIAASGFHEIYALMLCIALLGGSAYMWIETDSRRWTWSLCLVAAVVGFLIVYMAPGNEARRSHFAQAGSVDATLRLAARHGVPTVAQWVFDVRLISATVVLLMLQSLNGSAGKVPGLPKVLIVVLTATFTTVAALLGGYWAAGIELPDRTLGGIYMGFLVGWFAIVIQAAGRLAADPRALRFSTPLARLASITFASSMLLTGNTWIGLLDLPRSAPTFRRGMQDRWILLRTAASSGSRDIEVPRVWVRPKLYISADYFEIREDPEHWENFSVARYFHLRSVQLAPAPRDQQDVGPDGNDSER